jgi:hypothetical protein
MKNKFTKMSNEQLIAIIQKAVKRQADINAKFGIEYKPKEIFDAFVKSMDKEGR